MRNFLRGGDPWSLEIERRLRDCDIFVLLVSPNSLSSDYVVDKEISIIRERQANREDVRFYPLVLTPTPDAGLDLVRDLNLRPRDGKPFSDYPLSDRYRLMNEAANEIAIMAKEIAKRKIEAPTTARRESPLSNNPVSVQREFLGRDGEHEAIDAALEPDQGRAAPRGPYRCLRIYAYDPGQQTNVFGDAKLTRRHLARPAAGFQPHMGVGEGEAEIGQRAMVGRRRHQYVGVLSVQREVARAEVRTAVTGTERLRRRRTGLRTCGGCGRGQQAAGTRRHHGPSRYEL